MCVRGALIPGGLAAGVGGGCGNCSLHSTPALLSPVLALARVLVHGMRLGSLRFQLHGSQLHFSPGLRMAATTSGSSLLLWTLSAAFVVPHVMHDPVNQGLHGILSSRGHPVRGVA